MEKLNSYGLVLSFVNRKKWNYCAVFWENYVNIRFKFYTCFKHNIFLGGGFYRNCVLELMLILFGVKWVFFAMFYLSETVCKKNSLNWMHHNYAVWLGLNSFTPLFLTILLNDIWS